MNSSISAHVEISACFDAQHPWHLQFQFWGSCQEGKASGHQKWPKEELFQNHNQSSLNQRCLQYDLRCSNLEQLPEKTNPICRQQNESRSLGPCCSPGVRICLSHGGKENHDDVGRDDQDLNMQWESLKIWTLRKLLKASQPDK